MEESYFDGNTLQLIGYSILSWILTAATFGFGYPWAMCMLQRWEAEHTVVDSHRLVFDGRGEQFLGLWFLLSILPYGILIIGFGLMLKAAEAEFSSLVILIALLLVVIALCYSYFVRVRTKKWIASHTHFKCKPSYAYPAPDSAAPPTAEPVYIPAQSMTARRPAEPDLLDKLIPPDSIREKVAPFVAAILSFSATMAILIFLFA